MNNRNEHGISLNIDIVSVLLDLKRHWWNILLMALSGILLGYVISVNFYSPTYTSHTVVAVLGNSNSTAANVKIATKISGSITGILKSDALKGIINNEIGNAEYSLDAQYITDTNLINISASAKTPQLAFKALDSALKNYPALLSNLMSDLYIVTVEQPRVATSPTENFNVTKLSVLGMIAAVVLYAGAVAVLSLLRDTVKNSSDMRRKIDATFLGEIPYAKTSDTLFLKNGKIGRFPFEENYQMVASRIMAQLNKTNGKSLAVTSVVQNEGKTHCLLNLAYAIAKNEKNVLVIDADFRNPSIANLIEPNPHPWNSLEIALQDGSFNEKMLFKIPKTSICCLINTMKNGELEYTLSNGKFGELLKFAAQHFDYILVDTGPTALVADTAVIVNKCDASVLLVAQDVVPIGVINDVVDILEQNGRLLGCVYRETRTNAKRSMYRHNNLYGSKEIYGDEESILKGNR